MGCGDRYREWYEHECDCNDKMLTMLDSVSPDMREDDRFVKAVNLAAHLAACRENWLDRMTSKGESQVEWFEEHASHDSLRQRFKDIETRWKFYLRDLTEEGLACDFIFPLQGGRRFRWSIGGQIVQLVGHAFYHRGQISMLVDDLGGKTVDTDYLFWACNPESKYGFVASN